ncbi:hypothetical protein QYF36_007697 [Acer negundo]|nr:hypothetical protein QYF36_007697 [Acer negundo]
MTSSKKGLMEHDLSKLDVTKLHPLSPEVISRQATINIGTIGHVAHGKSTVVNAISVIGVSVNLCTKANGCTKEDSPLCDVPGFENCRMKLLRHVSFVARSGTDCVLLIN